MIRPIFSSVFEENEKIDEVGKILSPLFFFLSTLVDRTITRPILLLSFQEADGQGHDVTDRGGDDGGRRGDSDPVRR